MSSAFVVKPPRRRSCTIRTSSQSRSEEHTSELQSLRHLVCRLLLEKKKYRIVREFRAHAIDRRLHEEPQLLHYRRHVTGLRLPPRRILPVESMINDRTKANRDHYAV